VLKQHDKPSDEDPRCGKFGGYAARNGRLLSATVTQSRKNITNLTLCVTALPGSRPLKGKVRFYLHDTYDPASYTVDVRNGSAVLEINAGGVFTVGAKTDGDRTMLELNLARIPGAHRRFYRA